MNKVSKYIVMLGCMTAFAAPAAAQAPQVPGGFTPLFDGYSLNGWKGDQRFWSVVDGAIVAKTPTKPEANSFLYYEKPYANFELRYKYRWVAPLGNSGVQIRSKPIAGNHDLTGLQVNVTPLDADNEGVVYKTERFNMLYNEKGDRQEMCLLGQRAEITRTTATGGGTGRVIRTVKEMVNDRSAILDAVRSGPEWTEVVVIAFDNRIVSAVNGMLAFDCLDNDPVGFREGLIGLQLHTTSGTHFEYKDIVIKPLISEPNFEGRFKTVVSPAPEPRVTYKDSTRAGLEDVALPQ